MAFANTNRQIVNFGKRPPPVTVQDLRHRISELSKRAAICRKTKAGLKHAKELEAIAASFRERITELERKAAEAQWATGGAHVR